MDGKDIERKALVVTGSPGAGKSAVLGRIINVGRLGGGHVEFDCNLHASKRIAYIGVTHRTRSMDELRAQTVKARDQLK